MKAANTLLGSSIGSVGQIQSISVNPANDESRAAGIVYTQSPTLGKTMAKRSKSIEFRSSTPNTRLLWQWPVFLKYE